MCSIRRRFIILGPEEELDWFRKQMLKRYEVEFKARLGGTTKDDKAVFLLNRPIDWDTDVLDMKLINDMWK